MSFRTRRVLFGTPFYMLFYFFLLKYLFLLFGKVNDGYTLLITIFLGILSFLPTLLEEKKSRRSVRIIANLYGCWAFCSLFFAIGLVVLYLLSSFIVIPYLLKLIMVLLVFVLAAYGYYHAHQLKVKEYKLDIKGLDNDLNIVHISDIHFGYLINQSYLNKLAEKLKELSSYCDLVIISGDLADGSTVIEEDDFLTLKDVGMPIIFTPGNHDYYPGIKNVYRACRKAGIVVLDNDKIEIDGLNIVGYTFSFGNTYRLSVEELKNMINPNKINLINYHTPYNWEEFSNLGFDIQLSGHSHGGQFYPIIFFSNMVFKYNKGLFIRKTSSGNKYLSVSTGVGVMDYPMRWGTDSEIVVLRLRKSS